MEYILQENYKDMCVSVNAMSIDDTLIGSSNFGKFIQRFESDDSNWIDKINRILEA